MAFAVIKASEENNQRLTFDRRLYKLSDCCLAQVVLINFHFIMAEVLLMRTAQFNLRLILVGGKLGKT